MADYQPAQTPSGDWKLHVSAEQYRAWRTWLRAELGRRFFPAPMMVVPMEWPPQTPAEAANVAAWFNDVRQKVNRDRDWAHPLAPVPAHPRPWRGGMGDVVETATLPF